MLTNTEPPEGSTPTAETPATPTAELWLPAPADHTTIPELIRQTFPFAPTEPDPTAHAWWNDYWQDDD